jgi:hypothetical protein
VSVDRLWKRVPAEKPAAAGGVERTGAVVVRRQVRRAARRDFSSGAEGYRTWSLGSCAWAAWITCASGLWPVARRTGTSRMVGTVDAMRRRGPARDPCRQWVGSHRDDVAANLYVAIIGDRADSNGFWTTASTSCRPMFAMGTGEREPDPLKHPLVGSEAVRCQCLDLRPTRR